MKYAVAFCLSVTSALLLNACVSTAKMALPTPAVAVAEHQVQGANPFAWDKPLQFGTWSTGQLSDKGRLDAGVKIGKFGLGGTYHAKSLTTNTGITASCDGWLLHVSKGSLALDPSLGNMPLLSCVFSGQHQGELSLRQDKLNRLSGQLVSAGAVYEITSEHQLEGGLFSSAVPVGFHLKKQQQLLWSVEKVNAGRVLVWQQSPVVEQDLLAAVSFVLLATDFDNLQWDEPVS